MRIRALGGGQHGGAVFVFVALGVAAVGPGLAAARSIPEVRGAAAYWTAKRMQRARPLDVIRPARKGLTFENGSELGPTPHLVRPRFLAGGARASSAVETVADPTTAVSRTNGAVFFETPFGPGRCSGTSVNSPNFSVVFTAGHCIHGGGRHGEWMDRRWVFVPGYRYGQRPFGVFPAKWIDTTRQWRTTGSENFDVGAAVVIRNQRGRLLGKTVGGVGIAWGLKARQVFNVHGYSAQRPFDGETQQVCVETPFLGHDARSFFAPGPLNLAVDCKLTGGSSGGGWTIRGGILNSVTNYGYTDDPDTNFGAYFGKEVGRLYYRAGSVK